MCYLTAEVGQGEMCAEFVIVKSLCSRRTRLLMKNYHYLQCFSTNKPGVMIALVFNRLSYFCPSTQLRIRERDEGLRGVISVNIFLPIRSLVFVLMLRPSGTRCRLVC
jgi:hypothetical protein